MSALKDRQAARWEAVKELEREFGEMFDPDGCDVAEGPVALVEQTVYASGEIYITMHKDIAAAASYHDNQEYPEDWSIRACVNVDTGKRFYPEVKTVFELYPDQEDN